ncbi:MAG: spondin domain-containing protein [Arenimonas sp.]
MKLQTNVLAFSILATLGLTACQQSAQEAMPAETEAMAPEAMTPAATAMSTQVKYRVDFTPLWTKANFPLEYPDDSLIHKPHFSGWIGTAHNDNYHLFMEGSMPTAGLERLSETGKHDPLDAEINAAVTAGNALMLTESDPLKDFTQTVSFEITLDNTHPSAALVAMIAPSPDWFAGVDVNLMENGNFVQDKTVDVMAWDSGGDDGTTYFADDVDTNPKKPSMASTNPHFMKSSKTMPVGTLHFTRM